MDFPGARNGAWWSACACPRTEYPGKRIPTIRDAPLAEQDACLEDAPENVTGARKLGKRRDQGFGALGVSRSRWLLKRAARIPQRERRDTKRRSYIELLGVRFDACSEECRRERRSTTLCAKRPLSFAADPRPRSSACSIARRSKDGELPCGAWYRVLIDGDADRLPVARYGRDGYTTVRNVPRRIKRERDGVRLTPRHAKRKTGARLSRSPVVDDDCAWRVSITAFHAAARQARDQVVVVRHVRHDHERSGSAWTRGVAGSVHGMDRDGQHVFQAVRSARCFSRPAATNRGPSISIARRGECAPVAAPACVASLGRPNRHASGTPATAPSSDLPDRTRIGGLLARGGAPKGLPPAEPIERASRRGLPPRQPIRDGNASAVPLGTRRNSWTSFCSKTRSSFD